MELFSASIPAAAADMLAMAFPGPGAARPEPIALLSLASRGDMKYADPGSASRRRAFIADAGLEPASCRGLRLVHSRNVLWLDVDDGAADLEADGLLALDPGSSVSVTVADCMPIWLLDRSSGAFGLLHSGWRGTGILERALDLLADRFGSPPSSVSAILGPSIGPCCYAVPEARAAEFAAEFGGRSVSRREGRAYLDLRAANLSIAERRGLGYVLSIDACTSCDARLGSYRRQGPAGFTRMLAACGHSAARPNVAVAEDAPWPAD